MKLASFLLSAVLLAVPLAAMATIYKWTDEHGTTVLSNRRPAAEAKVSNVQIVVEDEEPAAAPKAAPAPKPGNGNGLQQRVRALEQQVQSLQAQASSSATPYAGPYAAQALLPPATNYYPPPDYYPPPSYPSPMYGDGFPPMWGYSPFSYPAFASSFVVVAPGRFVRPLPPFAVHHHKFVHPFRVRPVPVPRPIVGTPVGITRPVGVSHRR